jgi:uncharacterized membrane protein (UPF0127 family)
MRLLFVLLLAGLAATAACERAPSAPAVEVSTPNGPVRFTVEVALTEAQQAQGLMYRATLAPDHGMLFVFHDDTDRAFWMKNTLIPLDMIFIAADDTIAGIRAQTTPLSLAPVSVGKPSRYVLEIAGGEAAKRGIRPGAAVTLHGVPHG